ncbi:MAG: ATP-binding protein [Lentisphaeria bacterium]|jgi:two-component system phosphate regulon sensor histidine kinase PhoR|nr:ATP-binding protein [Lentisphaeria bacterium]
MSRPRLFWKLWPSFLLVMAVCLLVTMYASWQAAHAFLEKDTEADLGQAAELLAVPAGDWLLAGEVAALQPLCRAAEERTGMRVTIIALDGRVLADSSADPAKMENHGNRPEVRQALGGEIGVQTARFSDTLRQPMVYVAVPVRRADGAVIGACRAARPIEHLAEVRAILVNGILLAGLLAAVLGIPFTLYISRRILLPIQQMQRVAARLAAGDMSARMPLDDTRELAGLAEAVNGMAVELSERIRRTVEQREELAAILASMSEGLIAIDQDMAVLRVNGAAERLLQISRDAVLGLGLVEAVRNPALHRLAQDALASERPVEAEIVLHQNGEEAFLQVRASRLAMPGDYSPAGAVMVLTDITRLKRLENLRRDFAANVSHELRTPVTSILGFVETLRDGAIDDREDALRFLDIVHAQASRLDALISDLLSLARIERNDGNNMVRLTRMPLKGPVANVVDSLAESASSRRIKLELDCPEKLEADINSGLFEQAVRNLVDNAIKYSDGGTTVRVTAARRNGDVRIEVADQGVGVAPEHIERLFERFYRVDKARSRDSGGTGLGLAIVKHVAQYHRGRVEVTSEVGKGSTFTIILPAPGNAASNPPA